MPRRFIDVELSSIVPDSTSWAGGNVRRWIEGIGTFQHMIGYGEFFWPDFKEHDGCILIAECDDESYRNWLIRFEGDKRSVESMINHVDLVYLFQGNVELQPTDEQLTYLGRMLREMWQAKLAWQFPGRQFVVELSEEQDGEPMITVYQPRTSNLRITDHS